MKVGIICAMDEELKPFLPHIESCETTEKAMLKIYSGQINGVSAAALYCGVCRVNAAIAAQILIDGFGADIIINSGTSGGMDETIALFDTVVSTEIAYHDMDGGILTEFHPNMPSIYFNADARLLSLAKAAARGRKSVRFGKMVTGEAFIGDDNRAAINEKYFPLCVDMESAGIAHVCYVNRIPFIAIRTVTDTAAHSGLANFEQNCARASVISKNFVLDLLKELRDNNCELG